MREYDFCDDECDGCAATTQVLHKGEVREICYFGRLPEKCQGQMSEYIFEEIFNGEHDE